MKKFIISISVIAFCLVALLCGCNTTTEKTDITNNKSQLESTQQTTDSNSPSQTQEQISDISSFQPPAQVLDIDTSKLDPSNDNIRFEYDELGRISKCYYKINDMEIYQGYIYDDDSVQIFSFNGSIVIDDVLFENVVYNENTGFSKYEGYYLKNILVN